MENNTVTATATATNSQKEEMNGKDNLITASNDENLTDIFHQIRTSKSPAVIKFGASWCRGCVDVLPAFKQFSSKFPKLTFVYADIDECPETTQHIRYTPTFHFYRDGERVDAMYGTGEERLHDRLWLHS
ncbi:thioredoxin-like 3-3 [Bidens hawaiensis]|uniref:thioredoxin-like 3-3 n=1 Tax=Bidens hawaiensis TaxID=980011 RepID=UPI0040498203